MRPPIVDYGCTGDSLVQERERYFLGNAKIKIQNLEFEDNSIIGTRPEDPKNIQRLKKIFETQGCIRKDPSHYVAVKISEDQLCQSLSSSGVSQEALLESVDPPELKFDQTTKLICLFGKHRLRAAEEYGEVWWIIDLYLDSIPDKVQSQLREESSNEKNFKDGIIYRTMRYYQLQANEIEVRNWWVKFDSDEKRKNVARFQLQSPLLKASDQLLPYIGLWDHFTASHFRLLVDICCQDACIHYLKKIHCLWSSLFPQGGVLVDGLSVRLLDGLMPGYSVKDRIEIEKLINSTAENRLFPLVSNQHDRDNLLGRLLAMSGRFLSLYTLTQDVTFLAQPASALRSLLPRNFKGSSISKGLVKEFQSAGILQTAEHDFVTISSTTPELLALVQLWLSAIRHFTKPRKEDSKKRKRRKDNSTEWDVEVPKAYRLGLLATLAWKLGFSSEHIKNLAEQHNPLRMTEAWIKGICQEEFLRVNEFDFNTRAEGCQQYLSGIEKHNLSPTDSPDLTTRYTADSARRRFNSPYVAEFNEQRPFLFLRHFFGMVERESYPTSFAVMREIISSFFGEWLDLQLGVVNDSMESDPIPLEQHPPGSPPCPPSRMDVVLCPPSPLEDVAAPSSPTRMDVAPLAQGFETEHCIAPYEKKSVIAGHLGSANIINTWCSSNQQVVVAYLFEDKSYIKFPLQGSTNMMQVLRDLQREHYFLLWDGREIQPAEHPYEDALRFHLILVGRNDHPWKNFNCEAGPVIQDSIISYVSRYVPVTGKRTRSLENDRGSSAEEDDDL